MKTTKGTWVIVANRAFAKVFDYQEGERCVLIRELEHPEGRAKNHELNSDKDGRQESRVMHNSGPMSTQHLPVEHEADRFAKELATMLDNACATSECGKLIIVAEPKFLGRLRAAIGKPSLNCLSHSIPKDIAGMDAAELERELINLIGRDLEREAS